MDLKTKGAEDAILVVGEVRGLNFNEVATTLSVDRQTLFCYKKHKNCPFACNPGEAGKTSYYHPALYQCFEVRC